MAAAPGDTTALVLAGGQGSRFRPYTDILPKPMIPVGLNEKPVLELIIKWLRKHGVRDILLLVNYKWKYIYNYFEDGSRFNVKIRYSIEEGAEYTGTGGAVLKVFREGLVGSRAIIWYGDILAPLDVNKLVEYHVKSKSDLTLVVAGKYKVPVGVVKTDGENNIIEIREKPVIDMNVTIGVGVLEPYLFDEKVEEELGKNFDFMGDFVPWLISRGYRVKAYVYEDVWVDVGSLESYKKLDMEWVSRIFEEY